MQEYQDSISDDTDNSIQSLNVIDHVQKLLTQANIANNTKLMQEKLKERVYFPASSTENPVRKVTMQRVQELGVSFIAPHNLASK